MGMGNYSMLNPSPYIGGQVYFDPVKGQYYTQGYEGMYAPGFTQGKKLIKTYIGDSVNANKSPVNNLVQQAMSAQANPVSMAQLFPYMNYGTNNADNTSGLGGLLGITGSGQFGAGRFLGSNVIGNPSLSTTT